MWDTSSQQAAGSSQQGEEQAYCIFSFFFLNLLAAGCWLLAISDG